MVCKQAFILAAGLGTRMQPITNTIPKPVIEIAGQSMITRVIDQLREAGVKDIFINSHYKADILKSHVEDYIKQNKISDVNLHILHETELLDTGGGVLNALQHMKDEPFFIINSDSIWVSKDNVFESLSKQWKDNMKALFLLCTLARARGYDCKGDFFLDNNHQIRRGENNPFVYVGVHITTPKLFKGLAVEKCRLMDIYKHAAPGKADFEGFYGAEFKGDWLHIGTPEGVRDAEQYFEERSLR